MSKQKKYDVFIAHAGTEDGEIAKRLQILFEKGLGAAVFRSSERRMRSDKAPNEQLIDAHRSAKVVVALITPHSFVRPWVLFEAGGAFWHPTKALFVVCAQGFKPSSLPSVYKSNRFADEITDRKVIEYLCEQIAEHLRKAKEFHRSRNSSAFKRCVTTLRDEALKGYGGWHLVEPTLAARQVAESPYEFKSLIGEAREQVLVAGQNLHHLTCSDESENYRRMIFDFLRPKKRVVQILVCRLSTNPAVGVWSSLISDDFGPHLRGAIATLRRWKKDAASAKIKGLDIRLADFVPLSVTFIDPKTVNGQMVLTPVVTRMPQSSLRPGVWFSKRTHDDIFRYYWSSYWTLFHERATTKPL